ncbi:hypothetical protein EGW08_011004 [Elysia chlorotica]|uniref:Uncharacterized protein n=1 Tax=Elysia chlorotica TaxID=188477 RepID=A0A433THZ3_ELYCH|nr:hypothetical protein EGW08_011004 [Elysia chlorotica]
MTMDLKQKLVTFVEEGRRKKTMQPTSSGFGAAAQTSAGSGLFGRTSQPSGGSGSVQGSLFGGSSGNSSTANSVFSNNKFGVLASGSTFGESTGGGSGGSLFGKPISNSGGAGGGSLFGSGNQNNNQLTSLLGAAPTASPGMFPTQGSQPSPGLFSSGAAASGQSSAPNVFGYSARQTAPNLFGASSNPAMAPAGSSNGLFGKQGATPTAQTSLLGQGPTGLGQVPSLFGKQIPGGNTQTSLLSTPPSLFGTPATGATPSSQTSLLGPAPTSQSPFFGGKGNNSVFGGTQGQSTPQGAPNLFGKPSPGFGGVLAPHAQPGGNNSGPGLFGKGGPHLGSDNTSDESSTLFTPLSDLTESEKAAFEAKAFTLGKIPIRPPPKELVNV